MARDYFAILGLTPGAHEPRVVRGCFERQRARLLSALHHPDAHHAAHRSLDELHVAYQTLIDPERQREYLASRTRDAPPETRMRRLIASALEDGLLRFTRRREILEQGRRLGFNEFQIHLLIAQVQFGDDAVTAPQPRFGFRSHGLSARLTRYGARSLAVACLATVLFLALRHWIPI